MLAAISEEVTAKGLSLENVTTELRLGQSGRREFVVTADCTSPASWDKSNLQDLVKDFTELKTELQLDIMDLRVQKKPKRRESIVCETMPIQG